MNLSKRINSSGESRGIEPQTMCVYKIKGACPEEKCDGYGHIRYKKRFNRNNKFYATNRCGSYAMD